jgi:nicotinamidase/pyrazinamidase
MKIFQDDSGLLIIDMIKDFVDRDGSLAVPAALETVQPIAELLNEARERNVPVIYINDAHDPDDIEFEFWPPHAVVGTEGSAIIDELKPQPQDTIVGKKKYLHDILKKKKINSLVLTGTVTNICVLITSIEAMMRGYDVTVVRDAVSAINEEDGEFALRQIEQIYGGKVI